MRYIGKTLSILTTLLLILVIALNGLVLVGKMREGKAVLLGYELMVVLSGSMTPTFATGSIVAVKPVPFPDIKKGDIITFKSDAGYTVTHRVVDTKDGRLVTKGDANPESDMATVAPDKVVGRVSFWLPYMGYLITFMQSKLGMFLFLAIPGVYLIGSTLARIKKLAMVEEEKRKGIRPAHKEE
ncbi:signal peptidase I [Brevibacillus fluminis]|uniref:signal peptidase I n=1 Tax=Brevibacillus fluminis TaxID=511487 RepID=UPI003F89A489